MSPEHAQWVEILARILMGSLFVIGGLHHLPIFGALSGQLAQRGVPLPRVALALSTAWQIVLGVLLMAGLWVPWAALGLIVFTVVASLLLLNFWSMEGHARDGAKNQFLTNVAVIGGLLYAAVAAA
jgi:putative oxidoreductase